MRDYLERAYGVGVVSVRSFVQQQPITRITRDGRNFGAWRRPKSEKRMTVELREPFVWPEEPKDLSKYVSWRLMHKHCVPSLTYSTFQVGEGFLGCQRAVPANYPQAKPTEAAFRRGAG